eukprot:TRINITY_DN1714_c0_g4_i3.p1 TRINITY_DN1714_c0_g4~~TRINITY_DN1714_c0_g4_i3.p1  ORF type:complete len:319 (+),score=65.74 TRINITY_DN1714_c0_g4_i3:633-1589(+)
MDTASDWFISRPPKPETDEEWVLMNETTPFSEKCHYIHTELLRSVDPGLFTHFCDLDVEPQIYLLRWIRCMFGREFSLEHTLIIWDALFSSNRLSSFVDYVAVAMLVEIRDELLSQDRNGVLALLFKYPQDLSVTRILERAVSFNQRRLAQVSDTENSSTTSNTLTPVKKISEQFGRLTELLSSNDQRSYNASPKHPQKQTNIKPIPFNLNKESLEDSPTRLNPHPLSSHPLSIDPSQHLSVSNLHEQFHLQVSEKLTNIVEVLQAVMFDKKAMLNPPEVALLALAQLKQIKDVLGGQLSQDSLSKFEYLQYSTPNGI